MAWPSFRCTLPRYLAKPQMGVRCWRRVSYEHDPCVSCRNSHSHPIACLRWIRTTPIDARMRAITSRTFTITSIAHVRIVTLILISIILIIVLGWSIVIVVDMHVVRCTPQGSRLPMTGMGHTAYCHQKTTPSLHSMASVFPFDYTIIIILTISITLSAV